MSAQPATQLPRRLKVFLCHASGDKPAVRELYHRLRGAGYDPWLDEEKLLPGQEWELEIPRAVRSSDAVVICLSRRAVTEDEQPQHTLYLPDYYLARTPVTNAQYAAFVQASGHRHPEHWKGGKAPEGKRDHPVVNVSWYDAEAYCKWLAKVTGKAYGLPSEAEWEKGARGSDGRIYPWGDEWDSERCNSREGDERGTTPVGAYPRGASPYGLLDMAGDVWEWTRSFVRGYPYDPADGREDPGGGRHRVLRGGSWDFQRGVRCVAGSVIAQGAKMYYTLGGQEWF